jgi:type III restriction enzyme
MKIKFNAKLDYQKKAIKAVTDVFLGQKICSPSLFTPAPIGNKDYTQLDALDTNLGIGNNLKLLDEDIHNNIRKIQIQNSLAQSESFSSKNGINLTVEMETGIGKTYVYLRTIFELNKLYGFTKFIIVVPSVAIKEGVDKNLQITEQHFKSLYDNTSADYFVYNSSKLTEVRNFATSSNIQIMVINIDAFRKSFNDPEKQDKANIIHRDHDRLSGAKPIEFIQQTKPIVIIDEPQSVANTPKSKEAIASLKPLCTLRYSATHIEKHHMLYKLDAIDAYAQKLVKQIEVASITTKDSHNRAYIKLLSVNNKTSPITATIEIDKQAKNGSISRKAVKVTSGADLTENKYSDRDIYDGYIIDDIYCELGNEYISFTSKEDVLYLNQAIGEVKQSEYQRLQICKTIEEHLDKELKLIPQGIKVLSLFFIDKVANYRSYDKDGKPQLGKFATMFAEEYKKAIRKPKYKKLAEAEETISEIHNGYFSVDKKKDSSGNELLKDTSGKTAGDETAYNLIMKDKEKLLSLDCKLKFIFSHSALREGWDNPNVFQICTLNETKSVIKKRQEIGRGLRLAVNQQGERMHGFNINTLTVMANESYEQFAEKLQQEIEEELGIKFGIVAEHDFANIVIAVNDSTNEYLGAEASKQICNYLKTQQYIDNKGKIQDSLKTALKNNELELPTEFQPHSVAILKKLHKIAGDNLNLKNRDDKQIISVNKQVFLSEDFKQLWDRIKYKTTYRVNFDVQQLIDKCATEIRNNVSVTKTKFNYEKAKTNIDRGGVHIESTTKTSYDIAQQYEVLPDIITDLQDKTNLTRKTIVAILNASGKLAAFKTNPQKFIEQVVAIIKTQKRLVITDGIKYQKIGNDSYYAQQKFEDKELSGYLKQNMLKVEKSVFDHVVYDSSIERNFAESFETNTQVKLYAKLPNWFKVATPLGNYNPDWAVLIEDDGEEKLYFVVETKSTLSSDALRPTEQAKFKCGEKHFKALNNDVQFKVATDASEIL